MPSNRHLESMHVTEASQQAARWAAAHMAGNAAEAERQRQAVEATIRAAGRDLGAERADFMRRLAREVAASNLKGSA